MPTTFTCLGQMLSSPGIYLVATSSSGVFVEVDKDGRAFQLNPRTYERDGELSREGWEESKISRIHGPWQRV